MLWSFLLLIRDFFVNILSLLDSYFVSIGGSLFSLLSIFIGFILLSMVVNFVWKGISG